MKENELTEFENSMLSMAIGMGGGSASEIVKITEQRGQAALEYTDQLPNIDDKSRKVLGASGVIFGEQVNGDPLFYHVKLPEGWTKKRTDHYMYTDLLDDKGRVRASIMYKLSLIHI